ncbi:DUF1350 family protein [Romeria aff. gracilis LEGE 07310]|uniref:DUF1350 family protein n=1 Tax=Vasconcelosia minhoensis LEGE 07310 TaxID=915328 RepID=A0A8J7DBG8_9CYAN|nr:DUF1350 family protein [Romeria gracilis]MBE9076388.1 DUF1350 family protein [Romeria aff. gracilis LEGE 07310]
MYWREVAGNWFLVPENPIAIVHFLGGAFVATAPHLTYRWLLEALYREGYCVIATPFVNTFDHSAIAAEVQTTFEQGLLFLRKQVLGNRYLPIYGLGHSMGCKVHLLVNSLYDVERAGNIYLSFNNYPARKSIPLLEQFVAFAPTFQLEFTPSPEETLALIANRYGVRRNLLVKFRDDTIDQTRPLSEVLCRRFPDLTTVQILKGSHTTPIAQDVAWKAQDSFSPLDAVGQFFKQEFYRDLNQLKRTILQWLEPFPVEE